MTVLLCCLTFATAFHIDFHVIRMKVSFPASLPNTSSKETIFMKRLFPVLVPFINDSQGI